MLGRRAPLGVSIGSPGASLADSGTWAQDANVGAVARMGEVRTARVLDAAAARPGGFTALHDLTLPGSRANIDHVIVSGQLVLPLDSKVWGQGRYVTTGGVTTRDGQQFAAADSQSVVKAATRLAALLPDPRVEVADPWLLVWPSPTAERRPDIAQVAVPGLRVLRAEEGLKVLSGRRYRRAADPDVVEVLAGLVVEQGGGS